MSAGSDRLSSVRNEKLQIRTPFLMFVGVVQIILLAVHWFLYDTWVHFWYAPPDAPPAFLWPLIFALSFTFVAASVLSLQTGGAPVRWFYTFSAVWVGFASFAFYAAVACWIFAGWEFMGIIRFRVGQSPGRYSDSPALQRSTLSETPADRECAAFGSRCRNSRVRGAAESQQWSATSIWDQYGRRICRDESSRY